MLNKSLQNAVNFANFTKQYNLDPYHTAQLLQLVQKRKNAAEKCCNIPDPHGKLEQADQNLMKKVEDAAKELGFDVYWPGLFPVLKINNLDIHLPEVG